jgi:hypothetical protein
MELKYVRIRLFGLFLEPFARWQRTKRMKLFVEKMGLGTRRRVLDLGGLPGIWDTVETVHDITFLNLPGTRKFMDPTHHTARHVEGDGCHVDQFGDESFEIVFSNSVIEHVGPEERMAQFAGEARRLGRSYWVQTPAKSFPIEAHCGMPFWWYYPQSLRNHFLTRWRKKLPAWTDMVEGTRVLSRDQIEELFPDAEIHVERFFGIPKSYVAFRLNPPADASH